MAYILLPTGASSVFIRPPARRMILVPDPPSRYSVRFHGENIIVTVAKKADHVNQWISLMYRLHSRCPQKLVVGLDTEWRPNLEPGEDHPVAIIQLCIGRHCLVFQLLHADHIPRSLHAFLGDPRFTFCGVGVRGDVKKLCDHHGLHVGNVMDLNALGRATARGSSKYYKHMGLKEMSLAILGSEMAKPLNVTLSAWDANDLDGDQIEYAAIDAFVSFKLAYVLYSMAPAC